MTPTCVPVDRPWSPALQRGPRGRPCHLQEWPWPRKEPAVSPCPGQSPGCRLLNGLACVSWPVSVPACWALGWTGVCQAASGRFQAGGQGGLRVVMGQWAGCGQLLSRVKGPPSDAWAGVELEGSLPGGGSNLQVREWVGAGGQQTQRLRDEKGILGSCGEARAEGKGGSRQAPEGFVGSDSSSWAPWPCHMQESVGSSGREFRRTRPCGRCLLLLP